MKHIYFTMQQIPTIEWLYKQYIDNGAVISTDTRSIQPGSIYFALKGANFNGNTFAAQALANGAILAIVDEDPGTNDNRIYYTPDALAALQQLATYHRRQLTAPVIAIGGSNGKTTTKELLYAVLGKKFATHATKGNLNNHIGVPLTLLSVPATAEMVIIEMGTNQPGDMAQLCAIAEPSHGIITNIGKEHLELLGDIEGVAKEESVLYQYLQQNGGVAFVNNNDDWLEKMGARLQNTRTYGFDTPEKQPNANYKGVLLNANPAITCLLPANTQEVKAHLSGAYNFQNILAAAAIGDYFGVSAIQIQEAVEGYEPTNNRSQIVMRGSNTLYMDCYNANPSSMEAALRNFATFAVPNKIVVLGDMFELGSHAPQEHQNMAALCVELGFEHIFCVGPLFAAHATSMKAMAFETSAQLKEYFLQHPPQNSYLLFKASRGIALEKAAEGIV